MLAEGLEPAPPAGRTTTVTTTAILDDEGLAAARGPLTVVVREHADPERADTFLAEGVARGWTRTLVVEPAPADPDRAGGAHRVTQTVAYHLEIPGFTWLFGWAIRREARRLPHPGTPPWWAPPDPLDLRAGRAISALAILAMMAGFLGTLVTQTIAFAGKEFGVGTSGQGDALAVMRVDAAIAVAVVALADRIGRRPILIYGAIGAILSTASGALAPSMAGFVVLQVPARGLTAGVSIMIAVVAAEEVPAGARAWTASVLAMIAALGAGVCVATLPLADLGRRSWRYSFLAALVFIPLVVRVAGTLQESRRFDREERLERTGVKERPTLAGHLPRLVLLAVGAALTALFLTPAAQLQNTFLANERGFSAARITLFSLVTGTPGGIGVVMGGRIADRRGRRGVASIGVAAGCSLFLLSFFTRGWPMWVAATVAGFAGGATVPALSVYGPELFPTALRGRANGVISATGRAGSVAGLVLAGRLADRLGGLGPALAVLGVGPLLLCVLIVRAYPETASRELEDINPEDR